MIIKAISQTESNILETAPAAISAQWNGRTVAVADHAYLQKPSLEAGAGPGMFTGMGRGLITIALVFAAVVAGLAVCIEASFESGLRTFCIIVAVSIAVNLFLQVTDPTF